MGYVFVYGGWKLTANATNVSSVMRIPFKFCLLYTSPMGGGHVSRPDFGMPQPDAAYPLTEFYLLADTMESSATILFLIAASSIMSYVMSYSGIPAAISNAPVSYTHLDVYKRQALLWPYSAERLLFIFVFVALCGVRQTHS